MKQPWERQKEITDKIEAAHRLLEQAAQLACPLRGWCKQWEAIGKTCDTVKKLWWKIHLAPLPGTSTEDEP